ncbi:histidine phosphatase family protein [Streptomyces sp. PSKA54]|uniref:Histidine phosphatase family protein n=1 Tax=Streptomyces himalayensis subsp. aureolus TaxID=2758039 RepID=A0A7W2D3W9_9ACTN|nr:histidine phosphatase family protein [Streptomyces himalayensis]MBA4864276.1 histidine phosphatase family protein [Streptomyces himalayensis subsp. aureolus]
MTVRLTFVCAAAGEATMDGDFDDGPLSERGLREADAAGAVLPPYPLVIRAPSIRCAQTADALGLKPTVEPALRDLDYGKWRGFTSDEAAGIDPYGFSLWLTDPDAAPHGGESVHRICERTADWLSRLTPDMGRVLAITQPAVVRAALVHALSMPARAFWHFDVPPLFTVSLASRGGCWNVRPSHITPGRAASGSCEHVGRGGGCLAGGRRVPRPGSPSGR